MTSFHELLCYYPVLEDKQIKAGSWFSSLLRPCCLTSMALKKLSSAHLSLGLCERKACFLYCQHNASFISSVLCVLQMETYFWFRKLNGQKFAKISVSPKESKIVQLSTAQDPQTDWCRCFTFCKASFALLLQNTTYSLSVRSYQNPHCRSYLVIWMLRNVTSSSNCLVILWI